MRWWWSSFPFGSFGLSSRLFSSEMISLVAGRKKVNEHAMKYDLPSRSSPFTNTVFLGSFDMEGMGGWVQIAMKRDFPVQDHLRISRRSQSMTRESGWPNYSSNIFRKSIADLESVEIAKRDTSLLSKFIGFCICFRNPIMHWLYAINGTERQKVSIALAWKTNFYGPKITKGLFYCRSSLLSIHLHQ